MMIKFSLQIIEKNAAIPKRTQIKRWLETLTSLCKQAEICIRIVDETESATLNNQFRQKSYPTNVLSFPVVTPEEISSQQLDFRQGATSVSNRSVLVVREDYEPSGNTAENSSAKRMSKYLGDLVLCPAVIEREAKEQHKTIDAHWAHMIIHGTLHLLGYDHIEEQDANVMETLEIKLLQQLGYPNPYEDNETL